MPAGGTSGSLGATYVVLGEALSGSGRAAEAKTALADALQHLDDAVGPEHPTAVKARALLAHLPP